MFACHVCGAELDLGLNAVVGRRDECPSCRAPLHACRNCAAYDDSRQNGCIEPNAEPPRDKAMANFCDFFALRRGPMAEREADQSAKARAALDALFGDGSAVPLRPVAGEAGSSSKQTSAQPPKEEDQATRARRALDDLFKK
jgi:hypothetical protein